MATMTLELDRELATLRAALRAMAESAQTRLATALEAWMTWDIDLAQSIRTADDEIDQLEVNIENECMAILAKHSPVASDLRYVVAALRINTSFERIADLARSVAKRVIRLDRDDQHPTPPQALETMGEAVKEMLSNTMRALENRDVELARFVRKSDAFVDDRNREVFEWVAESTHKEPARAEAFISVLMIARSLERIGDICANIAEDIMFAVGGSIVRHTPA
ncbi:MAG: phosphate signaling complex protein PhoU [Phycisphaerales bacterium]|nr:phosphate signaling complex protein PhoU [Phycisphaerales bacterium]